MDVWPVGWMAGWMCWWWMCERRNGRLGEWMNRWLDKWIGECRDWRWGLVSWRSTAPIIISAQRHCCGHFCTFNFFLTVWPWYIWYISGPPLCILLVISPPLPKKKRKRENINKQKIISGGPICPWVCVCLCVCWFTLNRVVHRDAQFSEAGSRDKQPQ